MMFLRVLPIALLCAAPLLLGAGQLYVPTFWAYAGLLWVTSGTLYTLLQWKRPDLVRERMKPPADRDKRSRRLAVPLILGHLLVAGLDVGRFGWSAVPFAVQLVGFALLVGSLALVGWTLLSNPYASSAVRIQAEREQRVITTGPYARVRHPMYLGVFLFAAGSPLALGSWPSGLLMLPVLAVFVRRTRVEDRMLHEELPGYREYARKVRWRIVPGVF